ncbi:MAG TPA: Xaa-Pro peptidase family protein [Steroidobacteraceae bacterium]|jgi:Xaa-Pro aminopeptidase
MSVTDHTVAPLGLDIQSRLAAIDQAEMRRGRLAKVRAELAKRDYAAALLADAINIRYACGARNLGVWTLHAPGRYLFVPVDGPVVLFEFEASRHVSVGLETVDQVRKSIPWFYFLAGPRTAEKTALWAKEIASLMRECGRANQRLAVDRCEPWGARMLVDEGISLFDAQEPIEMARLLKTPEEIAAMQLSMDVCDVAVDRLRRSLRPGITENQTWSVLHDTNIAHDGEWIECRLLASGPRTNPWFQECGNRRLQAGDLVVFDTDMIGPLGYLADISRAFVCPGRRATGEQKSLYGLALEQLTHNMGLIRPGLTFLEFSERCWAVPAEYVANRYMMMVHGAGMADEYPSISYLADRAEWGYDGEFQENMVVCVESYIGAVGGSQGVKLEQQLLVTKDGTDVMSKSPIVDSLEF